MKEPKIVTKFYPLSPHPRMDWVALYEGEEERGIYGYGETEAEAILDLKSHDEEEATK